MSTFMTRQSPLAHSLIMATELPEPTSEALKRPTVTYSSLPALSKPFLIDPALRSYKHQYANIYFVRLVELRSVVEERAQERWAAVRGESINFAPSLSLR